MSWIDSLLLGIVQGLTEFLPVSSSAHLKITKYFLDLPEHSHSVLLDLSCHLGTLVALLYFLRKDISSLLKNTREWLFYFLALIPLIPCYFLLKPLRDLASQSSFLGPCLMITGLILLAGQSLRMPRSKVRGKSAKIQDVLMIGALQSAALIPGISRSAATISCARFLGWSSQEAVRFSFLLSIPTVIGGNMLELLKASSSLNSVSISSLGIAFATSLLTGLFLVKKALGYLEKGNIKPFAWYCLSIGVLTTLYFTL
ncbi:MAG: undecaprenyl-diphosphate phosphatase [Rhabdochlamydiaceae bacterium]|nr:undecaprenyl-diphosphate phosphatase [Rhabdochlamydiaceae bacterium]